MELTVLKPDEYYGALMWAVKQLKHQPYYEKTTAGYDPDHPEIKAWLMKSFRSLAHNPSVFVIVSTECGELTGIHMGYVISPWYCPHKVGFSDLLFVKPDANKFSLLLLMRRFEKECKRLGAEVLCIGKSSNEDFAGFASMATRAGYTLRNEGFTKLLIRHGE